MVDKTTHFGRAGEFYAMSELLLRGWNVAVPVIDLGDDVFVIDDRDKTIRRVQVKSTEAKPLSAEANTWEATFNLSRAQLRTAQPIELYYMFLVRYPRSWRFLLIPRPELLAIRNGRTVSPRAGAGRPALTDGQARTDALGLTVTIQGSSASGWEAVLDRYLDAWPADLPVVVDGPGTARTGGT
ncbi:hypothetical protein [Nannocystis bainbridge]|uniref:PD(D/E)XK endonuclease domain-containing protein n=1 Tax=Nannocystis bainbridge TaxID=2995303 RepID=A0ABT5DZH2_9BACT|nr:hypothetical protein [Nannocystis bainbridge]MDC0718995.1 hypothetical protein [Nannocystis bainbridge]